MDLYLYFYGSQEYDGTMWEEIIEGPKNIKKCDEVMVIASNNEEDLGAVEIVGPRVFKRFIKRINRGDLPLYLSSFKYFDKRFETIMKGEDHELCYKK